MLKLQNRFKRIQHSRWLLQGTDSLNTCANTVTWRCHSNPRQAFQMPYGQQQTAANSSSLDCTSPSGGLHQPFRCTRPSGALALPVHPFSGTIVTTRWNLDTNSFWEMPLCLYWGLRWCSGLCGTEKEHSHTPHKVPGYPASTHCSNSQHRWTNGKRPVRIFSSSKKPKARQ